MNHVLKHLKKEAAAWKRELSSDKKFYKEYYYKKKIPKRHLNNMEKLKSIIVEYNTAIAIINECK